MYGVLSDPDMPRGLLLDTIRHVETGGSPNPNYAMGSASELGAYQMRTDMLHDLGFGMPRNIDPFQLMDPNKSRDLAGQFIDSYSSHYSFDTPIEKLVAYNMGAPATAAWRARGSNYDELPQITKNYIRKALGYLNNQPAKENNMLQYTAMQRIADNLPDQTEESKDMIDNRNLQNRNAMGRGYNNAQTYPPVYPVADPELADIYGGINKTLDTLENTPQDVGVAINPTQYPQEENQPTPFNDLGYVEPFPVLNQQQPNPDTSSAVLTSPGDQPSSMFMRPAYAATLTGDEEMLRQGVLSQQNTRPVMNTDQARKQTPFSLPDQRIGRDEALIRIGGAMMGGSQQGGLAALQAATNQYGSIQDYNRSQALDAYNASVKAAGKQAANPNADASSAYQQSTINSIDEVVGLIDTNQNNLNPFDNVAGLFGSLMSNAPGSPAFDVDKMLNTIKANVGFDRLQAMRDSSPTGGALGQVTELELKLLQSSLAALDQGMSPKRFREQLMIVRDQYIKVTGLLAQDPALQGGMGGLSVQQVSPNVAAARNILGNN